MSPVVHLLLVVASPGETCRHEAGSSRKPTLSLRCGLLPLQLGRCDGAQHRVLLGSVYSSCTLMMFSNVKADLIK